MHIAEGGQLQLRSGVVRDHPIAVCLQDPDVPVARVRSDVRFVGHGVLVDTTSFPFPDPASVLDSLAP
ncbi:MAG: hypothetical protein ACFCGT_23545 [Sandaracinaceae bacterium]